jgi:hypothetical protein
MNLFKQMKNLWTNKKKDQILKSEEKESIQTKGIITVERSSIKEESHQYSYNSYLNQMRDSLS